MGGCAAPYCNNSAAKGYTMKRFSRNPERTNCMGKKY